MARAAGGDGGVGRDRRWTAFGEQYILRPGLPVLERCWRRTGDGSGGWRSRSGRRAQLPGDPGGWWPGRVRVRLGYGDRAGHRADGGASPGRPTGVAEAAGLPAPDWVWANAGDYGYGALPPDARSAAHVARARGRDARRAAAGEALGRALGPGARGAAGPDAIRGARPARAAARARRADRGRAPGPRLARRYALPARRTRPRGCSRRWEALLLARAGRRLALRTGCARRHLDAYLARGRAPRPRAPRCASPGGDAPLAGAPLRVPSRWARDALLAAATPPPTRCSPPRRARDTTPEAARRAFVAGAARPDSASKAAYFGRYFATRRSTRSGRPPRLGAFNDPAPARSPCPTCAPRSTRCRGSATTGASSSSPAGSAPSSAGRPTPRRWRRVDAYLAAHPELPVDVRRKVLQCATSWSAPCASARAAEPPRPAAAGQGFFFFLPRLRGYSGGGASGPRGEGGGAGRGGSVGGGPSSS